MIIYGRYMNLILLLYVSVYTANGEFHKHAMGVEGCHPPEPELLAHFIRYTLEHMLFSSSTGFDLLHAGLLDFLALTLPALWSFYYKGTFQKYCLMNNRATPYIFYGI